MPRSLTRAEIRDVDRRAMDEYGVPGVVLMENAGRSAVELMVGELGVSGPVTIVCGKGNNAGDGFVIARHLEIRGIDVEILLTSPATSFTGDAAVFFDVVEKSGMSLRDLSTADSVEWKTTLARDPSGWIVDALLGTGLTGAAREPFTTAIHAINASHRPIFAVDLPSGMDCDTGVPEGACIRADHTGTFVARKIGFDRPESATWTGRVHVLDIGIPLALRREIGVEKSRDRRERISRSNRRAPLPLVAALWSKKMPPAGRRGQR